MPSIIADLGGFSHYTWVTTAYIITSAVIIPIIGRLTDMYGRKIFYIAGLSIFLMVSLVCGLSNTMAQITGMFTVSLLMFAVFIYIESNNKEPIIPLNLFKNRIITVSAIVIFLTGFGMFGAIIFTLLFFHAVLGATATTSGNFLTPMMLGIVVGSLLSGQVLSRTGGHYKIQGIAGISIMALGMGLLSRINTETSYVTAVINITATGFGLGITMPLYTIAVQNAVPYNLLGVATSSSAFFRSIGGSVGLAVMGDGIGDE